jgi:hypothetical protein
LASEIVPEIDAEAAVSICWADKFVEVEVVVGACCARDPADHVTSARSIRPRNIILDLIF